MTSDHVIAVETSFAQMQAAGTDGRRRHRRPAEGLVADAPPA
jgi:hypothetical protein